MIFGLDLNVLDWNENVIVWILRMIIAAICGLAIGVERTARSKEAGIRTHTIVCLAAAIMMIVSKYAFGDLIGDAYGTKDMADPARIAAQVVSGIGFLGAGIIFYKRDLLHGLTTAAGIWATAGIGLAIGAGLVIIGVISTIMLIAIQLVLHKSLKFIKRKDACLLKITVELSSSDLITKILEVYKIRRFERFKTTNNSDGTSVAVIEAISEVPWTAEQIFDLTKTIPEIKSIEKLEEA